MSKCFSSALSLILGMKGRKKFQITKQSFYLLNFQEYQGIFGSNNRYMYYKQ